MSTLAACLVFLFGPALSAFAAPQQRDAASRPGKTDEKIAEAEKLGRSEKPSNAQRLMHLLRDRDEQVRAAAAHGLGLLLHMHGSPHYWDDYDDPITALQNKTGVGIVSVAAAGYRSALLNALKDPSPQVRAASATALGSIFTHAGYAENGHRSQAPSDIIEGILRTLRDPSDEVAIASARAAVEIGIPQALPGLLALAQRQQPAVRVEALQTLANLQTVANLNDRRAVEPFLSFLHDGDPAVRLAAIRAVVSKCEFGLCDAAANEKVLTAMLQVLLEPDLTEGKTARRDVLERLTRFKDDPRAINAAQKVIDEESPTDGPNVSYSLRFLMGFWTRAATRP